MSLFTRTATPPKVTEEFKNFIENLLKNKVKVSSKYIEKFLSNESLALFRLAFTDTTYFIDRENTREKMEFLGDTKINAVIGEYIINKHASDFSAEHWITYLQQRFKSKTVFAKIASELEFNNHILYLEDSRVQEFDAMPSSNPQQRMEEFKNKYGDKAVTYILSTRLSENKILDVLEDTFESFIGVLSVLGDQIIGRGSGYLLVYRFTAKIFDQKTYELNYKFVFNPITRIKFYYDFKGWHFSNKSFVYKKNGNIINEKNLTPEDRNNPNFEISLVTSYSEKQQKQQYQPPITLATITGLPINSTKHDLAELAYEQVVEKDSSYKPVTKPKFPTATPYRKQDPEPSFIPAYTKEAF